MTTLPNSNNGYQATVIEPQITENHYYTMNNQLASVKGNYSNSSSAYSTPYNGSTSSLTGPPPLPPHQNNSQHIQSYQQQQQAIYYQQFKENDFYNQQQTYVLPEMMEDQDYLPDSSLKMAQLAGKRRYDRLHAPADPQFPPVTVENINKFREESTNDPKRQFFFARFLLLDAIKRLKPNPQDPQRFHQLKESLMSEAMKIVKKLASHKMSLPEAQFFLANCYGGGLYGLKSDPEKAFNLYVQGSKQNHPECTYRAAVCYELGLGTRKDARYAMQFYRKAASLSDPSAIYKMGLILLNGLLGQAKNSREAISWFLKGSQIADEDHPQALHELALAYEKTDDDIPSIIPDINYARQLFSQAAQLGYAPSQFRLGLAYENGQLQCPIDPRRSIAWYSRAAEQDDANAELALSGWYLTGAEGVLGQNDQEAYLWAKRAAEKGLPKAEYAIGYYTETGVGVLRNLEEAKVWYKAAADHGDQKAKQRLSALLDQTTTTVKRRPTRDKNGKPNSKDSDCKIM
ncbi:uncharacterized protein BX663DRAFT_520137 [Cokeromyces recurvatus]|uniref:uncharacterized protein n=1 Tax=Cokeromyces recurvatus TaxID=90255 RepID=UPI00221E87B2|nr:uncharacterized protein BX663DRAFT_520137 [Cokeromyces recurvatus]KAI7899713.1 hypothetical protein BX663DRAFT_520137 [Cokeromyces recurvatus]